MKADMFSQKSRWIGLNEGWYKTGIKSPALQLRKTFEYDGESPIECLISGLGCFVFYINNQRVGTDILAPAFTDYNKRVLFLRYDITTYLQPGENVIAVKLGDGFYNQTTEDTWNFYHAAWRNTPRLRLEFFSNNSSVFVSDTKWKGTYEGATVHNAIRTGEWYDARKEDGWKENGYDDSLWKKVFIVRAPGGELYEQVMPNIRECALLKPVSAWETSNGWVFDFGKNISGYVGFEMAGNAGETLCIRYAEKLMGKEIDQSNINEYIKNAAFSEDRYTFRGNGVESWKPDFAYHGFQYVEISGVSVQPKAEWFTAYHVHTDLQRIGDFHCSNELFNWIYQTGIHTFLNNYHGFPEDCPHREKNGWTADAWLSSSYAITNFDMQEAYKKWLLDLCDTQRESGQICSIAPTSGWGYNWGSGPAWDYALFYIPYALYQHSGETECIRLVYPYCQRYLRYVQSLEENGTVCFGLPDWYPPKDMPNIRIASNRFSDSCFYYAMLVCMRAMAHVLGFIEDEDEYNNQLLIVKQAIRAAFIKGDSVDTDGQASLAMALYFDLVEGEEAAQIAKRLVKVIEEDNYRFKVGILGMKALPNALSKYGYTNIAYKMLNRYDYPSHGYWKKLGATTFWESWQGDSSLNHPMYGDVLDWMHRNIAGLQNNGIAYDNCLIRPYFFDENCSAECSTRTSRGVISVQWTKQEKLFTLKLSIPNQVQAYLQLPNQELMPVISGKYQIELTEI